MEGGVDYADYGAVLHYEADGDAEHGEEVGVVYGACLMLEGVEWNRNNDMEYGVYRLEDRCTMLGVRRLGSLAIVLWHMSPRRGI